MKWILHVVIQFCIELTALANVYLADGTKYLIVNGKPVFINGANYSPSKGWLKIKALSNGRDE